MLFSTANLRKTGLVAVITWLITLAVMHETPRLRLQARALGTPAGTTAGGRAQAVNTITIALPYSERRARMRYYTGAYSQGASAAEAPREVFAQARHEQVGVEIKSFAAGPAVSDAEGIARHVANVTQEIWPQAPVPVEVELHVMPVNSRYSFRRRVNWREGVPYYVTLFINADSSFAHPGTTAAHELYHVLAGRWRLGSRSPQASASPAAALVLEETAAYLYGYCAELVTRQAVTLRTVDIPPLRFAAAGEAGRTITAPFDASEALYMLEHRTSTQGASLMGEVMAYSMLQIALGEHATITTDMPEAEVMKDLCRHAASDPFSLRERLAAEVAATRL